MGARKPQPDQNQAPVVQRIRIRYAKRGPLRFSSHRDFARAFERAVRRAGVPVAYSQGFTPHPKISYAGAAPTGVASEAEYLEIGLQAVVDPARVGAAIDAALSPGLDVLAAVEAEGPGLDERIDASRWRVELPEIDHNRLEAAVTAFLAADEILVERMTKQGRRRFDTRSALVRMTIEAAPGAPRSRPTGPSDGFSYSQMAPAAADGPPCAILDLVVRQVTPSVRPDDILAGLRVVADLEPPVPPRVTRLAQGRLTAQGEIVDPLVGGDRTVIGQPSE
jgi:radical SAM-linked protein